MDLMCSQMSAVLDEVECGEILSSPDERGRLLPCGAQIHFPRDHPRNRSEATGATHTQVGLTVFRERRSVVYVIDPTSPRHCTPTHLVLRIELRL